MSNKKVSRRKFLKNGAIPAAGAVAIPSIVTANAGDTATPHVAFTADHPGHQSVTSTGAG